MADIGNQVEEGKIHGVVYDKSQLSAEEAGNAEPNKKPRPKVVAATLGAAIATIILFVLSAAGAEVSVELGGAITVLATFITGYRVKE